jgi:hypothetical protein
VIGEASIETPKAIAEPAVKAATLSAKVAVPLFNLIFQTFYIAVGGVTVNFYYQTAIDGRTSPERVAAYRYGSQFSLFTLAL